MAANSGGVLVRTRVAEVKESSRVTMGVKLIALDENAQLVGLQKVAESVAEIADELAGEVAGEVADLSAELDAGGVSSGDGGADTPNPAEGSSPASEPDGS
jgi:DNA gyrase subunit A